MHASSHSQWVYPLHRFIMIHGNFNHATMLNPKVSRGLDFFMFRSCSLRVHFVRIPQRELQIDICTLMIYIYIYTSYLYIYIHYMYTIDIYEKLCTYIIYLGFFLLPNRVIFPLPFLRRPKKREKNLGLGQGCHIPMICPIFIAIKNAWWHTINPFLCPINGHWLTLFILTLFILTLDFIV